MRTPMIPRPSARLLLLLALAPALSGCGDEYLRPLEVTPPKYDFGRIRHGETRQVSFVLKNNSDRAITIAKAEPNCGCFKAAPLRRRRLDPGRTTKLTILFDSGAVPAQRLRGKFLEIRTDHPEAASVRVPLEGHIFAPVRLEIEGGLDKLYYGLVGSADSLRPRRCFLRRAPGYEARLDTRLQHFERGYAIYPASLASLFDVRIQAVAEGYDVSVALTAAAKHPRPEQMHSGMPGQMQGTITFRVEERGRRLAPRTIPYTVKIHGTWPSRSPPGD